MRVRAQQGGLGVLTCGDELKLRGRLGGSLGLLMMLTVGFGPAGFDLRTLLDGLVRGLG